MPRKWPKKWQKDTHTHTHTQKVSFPVSWHQKFMSAEDFVVCVCWGGAGNGNFHSETRELEDAMKQWSAMPTHISPGRARNHDTREHLRIPLDKFNKDNQQSHLPSSSCPLLTNTQSDFWSWAPIKKVKTICHYQVATKCVQLLQECIVTIFYIHWPKWCGNLLSLHIFFSRRWSFAEQEKKKKEAERLQAENRTTELRRKKHQVREEKNIFQGQGTSEAKFPFLFAWLPCVPFCLRVPGDWTPCLAPGKGN